MLSQRSVRGGKAGMKDSCPTVLSRKALNFSNAVMNRGG